MNRNTAMVLAGPPKTVPTASNVLVQACRTREHAKQCAEDTRIAAMDSTAFPAPAKRTVPASMKSVLIAGCAASMIKTMMALLMPPAVVMTKVISGAS